MIFTVPTHHNTIIPNTTFRFFIYIITTFEILQSFLYIPLSEYTIYPQPLTGKCMLLNHPA